MIPRRVTYLPLLVVVLSWVTLAALLLVLLWFPTAAHAWNIAKGTNGVIVSRESSDTTAQVIITRRADYIPGDTWSSAAGSTSRPSSKDAYRIFEVICYLDQSNGVADSIEVPLKPGYRCQLVSVADANTASVIYQTFAILNESLAVALPATQSVAVSSLPSVLGTVAVSNHPTAAAVDTGAVTAVRVVSAPTDPLVVVGWLCLLFGVFFIVGFKAVG